MFSKTEKIFFSVILIYVCFGFAWLLFGQPDEIKTPDSIIAATPAPSYQLPINSAATSSLPSITPTRLAIPAINVDANVQQVGLTSKGNMGIPTNYTDAGWLTTGAKPGETGNAVMDGHLDTRWWTAGVFRHLKDLKPGDDVYVTGTDGTKLHFKVIGSKVYDENQDSLTEIFGATSGRHLNLITCDGTWNQLVKRYDQRLVVFTELVI